MKPEQINLIRGNFERIAPRAEAFATVFYNRLFALQPVLRLLFPADLTEQKKKLTAMLALAIKSLDEPEKLIPVLENLGRRHALYGVRDEHYETVGAALLRSLRETLGEDFTREADAAWAEMYELVAAAMKRASREMAQKPEETEIKSETATKIKTPVHTLGRIALLLLAVFFFNDAFYGCVFENPAPIVNIGEARSDLDFTGYRL